jgi:hypothetical protein
VGLITSETAKRLGDTRKMNEPTSQMKRHTWDHFHECGDGSHEAHDLMWSSCDSAALVRQMLLKKKVMEQSPKKR